MNIQTEQAVRQQVPILGELMYPLHELFQNYLKLQTHTMRCIQGTYYQKPAFL